MFSTAVHQLLTWQMLVFSSEVAEVAHRDNKDPKNQWKLKPQLIMYQHQLNNLVVVSTLRLVGCRFHPRPVPKTVNMVPMVPLLDTQCSGLDLGG